MHRHGGWQLQAAFQVYQHRIIDDVLEALMFVLSDAVRVRERSEEQRPDLFGLGTP